jgi:hypothetical protein
LEIRKNNKKMQYRWTDCNLDFDAPVGIIIDGKIFQKIEPTTEWKSLKTNSNIEVDKNYYVGFKKS